MRFLIIHFLVQISFLSTVLGHFSQCSSKIFRSRPIVAEVFTQHPYHKKACYGLVDGRKAIYLFIYLIHYLNSITRSYKINLHRASMKVDTLNTPPKKLMS